MPMTRFERAERIGALRQFIADQRAEWPAGDHPQDVADELAERSTELREHVEYQAEIEARDGRILAGAAAGHLENGAAGGPGGHVQADRDRDSGRSDGLHPSLRAGRDSGLRTIDRCTRSGLLNARAADRLDVMVREDDPTTVGARYLAAVAEPAYGTAFSKMLRDPTSGHLRFDSREVAAVRAVTAVEAERALSVGTGSAGGFAVPIDLDPSILMTGSGAINPIRELAAVRTTVLDVWKGVSADTPTASYLAEAAEATDNSPTLVQPTITTQRGTAFVPVSIELSQDWGTVQGELYQLLSDARAVVDATMFLTGTGTNQPGGVLNIGGTGGLTTTQRIQTATTATTALADVYSLKQAIGSTRFMERAAWVAHANTLDAFYRFVASGSTVEPQIMPQGRGGPLLGKEFREWSTMSTALTTTSSRIAVFGDWSGYQIVDRLGSSIELIPHLFGATSRFPTGQRGVFFWWRTGAGVTKPNALRYLEVK